MGKRSGAQLLRYLRVNFLLANLIRWVAVARQEIGKEQLPVFLDFMRSAAIYFRKPERILLHLAEVATNALSETKNPDQNRLINEQLALFMEISGLMGRCLPN